MPLILMKACSQPKLWLETYIHKGRLVLRHRRPISTPFPNSYAHPLPSFSYSPTTGEIGITPFYPPNACQGRTYVLAAVPVRKPRTIIDDASDFLNAAINAPFSLFSGANTSKATPDQVFDGDIDLKEDEVVEEDRGEDAEVDDSPEPGRKIRVLTIHNKTIDDWEASDKAKLRRRWLICPLRAMNARTGA